jgi:hypothetical protein
MSKPEWMYVAVCNSCGEVQSTAESDEFLDAFFLEHCGQCGTVFYEDHWPRKDGFSVIYVRVESIGRKHWYSLWPKYGWTIVGADLQHLTPRAKKYFLKNHTICFGKVEI